MIEEISIDEKLKRKMLNALENIYKETQEIMNEIDNIHNQSQENDINICSFSFNDVVQVTNTMPLALFYKNQKIVINAWYEVLQYVCEILYNKYPEKFKQMVKLNIIHQERKDLNSNVYFPVLSFDKNKFKKFTQIKNTQIFVGHVYAKHTLEYAKKITDYFDETSNFKYEVTKRYPELNYPELEI